MQTDGLLTIGIPAYNGGQNLPGLLASIGQLGLPENAYEILIVDNASTDDTEQVVEQLKISYSNMVFYKNKTNIGRIENWNRVLRLARGEFLILMNVNDRFLHFNLLKYVNYLKNHPEIPLVMSDVLFEGYQYPNWKEEGVINLNAYIRKAFLNINYLEFHALGVLQQHIFRTRVIREHRLKFDPVIPRTTDRVFIAQVIKKGGGLFLYTAQPVVSWRLNAGRYHHQVHAGSAGFNFDELWGNEYRANTQVARIAGIPYTNMLQSQLVLASFMMLAQKVRKMKAVLLHRPITDTGMEISTAHLYYRHLKQMAVQRKIRAPYWLINMLTLRRAAMWFLKPANSRKKNRTIKDITVPEYSSTLIAPNYV